MEKKKQKNTSILLITAAAVKSCLFCCLMFYFLIFLQITAKSTRCDIIQWIVSKAHRWQNELFFSSVHPMNDVKMQCCMCILYVQYYLPSLAFWALWLKYSDCGYIWKVFVHRYKSPGVHWTSTNKKTRLLQPSEVVMLITQHRKPNC